MMFGLSIMLVSISSCSIIYNYNIHSSNNSSYKKGYNSSNFKNNNTSGLKNNIGLKIGNTPSNEFINNNPTYAYKTPQKGSSVNDIYTNKSIKNNNNFINNSSGENNNILTPFNTSNSVYKSYINGNNSGSFNGYKKNNYSMDTSSIKASNNLSEFSKLITEKSSSEQLRTPYGKNVQFSTGKTINLGNSTKDINYKEIQLQSSNGNLSTGHSTVKKTLLYPSEKTNEKGNAMITKEVSPFDNNSEIKEEKKFSDDIKLKQEFNDKTIVNNTSSYPINDTNNGVNPGLSTGMDPTNSKPSEGKLETRIINNSYCCCENRL